MYNWKDWIRKAIIIVGLTAFATFVLYESPLVFLGILILTVLLILSLGYKKYGYDIFRHPLKYVDMLSEIDVISVNLEIKGHTTPKYPWDVTNQVNLSLHGDFVELLREAANRHAMTQEEVMLLITRIGTQVLLSVESGGQCIIQDSEGNEHLLDIFGDVNSQDSNN